MSFLKRSSTWVGAGLMAAAFITITPSRALAQNKPQTWDVTPFLGINFAGDLDGASPGVGVAGAYNWSENLAFEGEFNWIPDAVGGDNNVDEPIVTLSANGVYSFKTESRFTPYGTLGIGIGHTSVKIKNPANDVGESGFEVNLGGGVKAAINEKLTVRADLRYFHTNDQPSFVRLYGGVVFNLPR